MKNTIYWNHLWLNVTEFGGKKSSLSDDIKVKFYDLIEFAITNKDEPFIVTEDLEREYELQISKRVEKLYSEAEKESRYRRDFFGNKHNLYEYNQELVIELKGTVGKSEYVFLVLLYLSFNSKLIPNIESWFETHNSILGYGNNDATKFKEVLNALLNYKALFSDDLYKGIVRQLGGGHLLDNDVYNTNIQIEQNNLALIQNNKIEVTKEFHTYNEPVHNFHPDSNHNSKDEIVILETEIHDFVQSDNLTKFKNVKILLFKNGFTDSTNTWQSKMPRSLVCLLGLLIYLEWWFPISRETTGVGSGKFIASYFKYDYRLIETYISSREINESIRLFVDEFKPVFSDLDWEKIEKNCPIKISLRASVEV